MKQILLFMTAVTVLRASAIPAKHSSRLPEPAAVFHHKTTFAAQTARNRVFASNRSKNITVRNVFTDPNRLWPQGKIPFIFDTNVPAFTKIEIMAAMQEIEMSSYSGNSLCVMFIPRTSEHDYVHISWTSGTSGFTHIGRNGGRQDMMVNSEGGRGHDDNLEILLNVVGLIPEVMRADRDQYLTVNTNNAVSIDPFGILTGVGTSEFGLKFDYSSLVLGSPYQYAKNKAYPVITAKQSGKVMGQSVSLSTGDVSLIQNAYHCSFDTSNVVNLLGIMPINCHFHDGICNLMQDRTDNFDWILQSGPTPTEGTGPNADSSSGSGKYLYAQAVGHHNQVARLISPQFSAGQYCFRVSVYMSGQDIGRLRISVISSGSSADFLNQSGPLGSGWYHTYSDLNARLPFSIQFEATIGNGDRGDIAIDDVYMYDGTCIEWN